MCVKNDKKVFLNSTPKNQRRLLPGNRNHNRNRVFFEYTAVWFMSGGIEKSQKPQLVTILHQLNKTKRFMREDRRIILVGSICMCLVGTDLLYWRIICDLYYFCFQKKPIVDAMSNTNILSLHTLPVELTYRILDKLRLYDIVHSMLNVCTRLNAIVNSYHRDEVSYYTDKTFFVYLFLCLV